MNHCVHFELLGAGELAMGEIEPTTLAFDLKPIVRVGVYDGEFASNGIDGL